MSLFLGIDTSNYTTSTALYDSKTGEMVQQKKLLPVKEGQLGLRQSDAVFHHTAQLHTLIEELLKDVDTSKIAAIAASSRTRPVDVFHRWREHGKNFIFCNENPSLHIFTSGGTYLGGIVRLAENRFV